MRNRMLHLTISYTTENERSTERHLCRSREEAEYLVTLVRQLAPLEFNYSAQWRKA